MKLAALLEEFDGLEPDEKLECLVEMADDLPAVSEPRAGRSPPECRVQECQTPVYLWVDLAGGAIHLEAEVSPQSPVVRGLVSLVVQGLEGATPGEVAAVPDDLVGLLGLGAALGMTRQRGLRGLVGRIKRETEQAARTLKAGG